MDAEKETLYFLSIVLKIEKNFSRNQFLVITYSKVVKRRKKIWIPFYQQILETSLLLSCHVGFKFSESYEIRGQTIIVYSRLKNAYLIPKNFEYIFSLEKTGKIASKVHYIIICGAKLRIICVFYEFFQCDMYHKNVQHRLLWYT